MDIGTLALLRAAKQTSRQPVDLRHGRKLNYLGMVPDTQLSNTHSSFFRCPKKLQSSHMSSVRNTPLTYNSQRDEDHSVQSLGYSTGLLQLRRAWISSANWTKTKLQRVEVETQEMQDGGL